MGDDGTYRYTGVSCDAATIISDGKIVTSLIDVTSLFAQDITLNPNGYIQSSNYRESGGSPASGFKIDAKSGTIKSYGMVARGGTFSQVTVSGTLILDVKSSIPSNLVNGEMFLYQSN